MLIVTKVWYYFYMKYEKIVKGKFIDRPNRFIAKVELVPEGRDCEAGGEVVLAHVKNTGRCRELLVPGAAIYMEDFRDRMGTRKLAYSLIGVEKAAEKPEESDGSGGQKMLMVKKTLMVNMDSQAPNKVVAEALKDGTLRLPAMGRLTVIRPEKTYGDSRFDFYLEDEQGQKAFMEVKGVTLENHGIACFPDAPTERGVKHIHELIRARREGYQTYILFVIQMEGMKEFRPNDKTHPEFGQALRQAAAEGVFVLAWECHVTEDSLSLARPVNVNL